MNGIDIADPYVERLIEAFSFMSARMQMKLDAEFPNFTQRLLEVLYPNYIAPTPSIAVASLHFKGGSCAIPEEGIVIKKNSLFFAHSSEQSQTKCCFRSTYDNTLWPIEISEARLGGIPPDIYAFEKNLPPHIHLQGCLRLKLRTGEEQTFSSFRHLNKLRFYLPGDTSIVSHLHELILSSGVAWVIGESGKIGSTGYLNTTDPLLHEDILPEYQLLPNQWNVFHGYTLLQEYFANPERFFFFTLNGINPALKSIKSNEIEVLILLSKPAGRLHQYVDVEHFSLSCIPLVNLFEKKTERISLKQANQNRYDIHITVDQHKPMDYEIYSISEVSSLNQGVYSGSSFRPLYQTVNQDNASNHGKYFSARREIRAISEQNRKYGTRDHYVGSELFISLVDQHDAPFNHDITHIMAHVWATNRDLPNLVSRNGSNDLEAQGGTGFERIGFVRPPSPPLPPHAKGEHAWRLIRLLNFNYLALQDMDEQQGGASIRDLLYLFVSNGNDVARQQIDGLVAMQFIPITRRIHGIGPLVYGRGVCCKVTVDEEKFSGMSPFLFGAMLEQFFARHVSINSFTETELHSIQRGLIAHWPTRQGKRSGI
jgi:type VI secretion system protein ImpG